MGDDERTHLQESSAVKEADYFEEEEQHVEIRWQKCQNSKGKEKTDNHHHWGGGGGDESHLDGDRNVAKVQG